MSGGERGVCPGSVVYLSPPREVHAWEIATINGVYTHMSKDVMQPHGKIPAVPRIGRSGWGGREQGRGWNRKGVGNRRKKQQHSEQRRWIDCLRHSGFSYACDRADRVKRATAWSHWLASFSGRVPRPEEASKEERKKKKKKPSRGGRGVDLADDDETSLLRVRASWRWVCVCRCGASQPAATS